LHSMADGYMISKATLQLKCCLRHTELRWLKHAVCVERV
jgi:hypothetical protein